MVLPVIMYTIRVQPYRRLNTEEWMILNWDSQESLGLQDQTRSILKEINPEYSLEGLMMKLKLQYFGHLMWRAADSLVKALMLKKDRGEEEKGETKDVMSYNHHILCLPLLLLSSIFLQHQGLYQWVGSSSHQVAKVLELQLHHQSFQWVFRVDFL